MTPAALQTQDLVCQRGERVLFERLGLQLAPGTVTWLRGRNGRGKTSLMRLLAGLSTPVSGAVHVAGQDIRKAGAEWRRHWVYVGHQNALKDDLSAQENLRFLAQMLGLPADPAVIGLALQRMGLRGRTQLPVRSLSQGQRRRVALARLCLSAQAKIWLLDEPMDALDGEGIEALNGLLSEHARQGGCVLLTSHQPLSLTDPEPQVVDLEAYAPQGAR